MTGRVARKVAFITGAARGQGRSHAIRLAQEGADILAVDLCDSVPSVDRFYPGATEADLAETVAAVEALDRRIVASKADVRDYEGLQAALDEGVARLGHVDIVVANAGIVTFGDPTQLVSEQDWQDVTDINSTGVWHTAKAAT
jgi:NAD(P)-dependent dehydrogenase (short-subunit alcohol dehydrogenase family)